MVRVRVRDDGRGGSEFDRGSGLVGLKDRVEALNRQIWLDSPHGSKNLPLTWVLSADGMARSRGLRFPRILTRDIWPFVGPMAFFVRRRGLWC
jgi:hypothetical protein